MASAEVGTPRSTADEGGHALPQAASNSSAEVASRGSAAATTAPSAAHGGGWREQRDADVQGRPVRGDEAGARTLSPPRGTPPLILEEERELFDCALCYMVFVEPVTLPCGHTFCRNCLLSALAASAACPLCRAPCFVQPESAKTNFVLSKLVQLRCPAEHRAHMAELSSEASAMGAYSMGLFIIADASYRFPHVPISLVVYEPRYLLLMQRCTQTNAMFGLQGSATERHGVAVRITQVRMLPHGRMLVAGITQQRYACQRAPEQEADTFGLYTAPVTLYDDGAAALPAVEDEAARIAAIMGRLPEPVRAAVQACPTNDAAASALANALMDTVQHMLSSLPPAVVHRTTEQYGPPLSMGASPTRLSYYLADILALPKEARHEAFVTCSTLHRLLLCYAYMSDAASQQAGGWQELAAIEHATPGSLPRFSHLPAHVVLRPALNYNPLPLLRRLLGGGVNWSRTLANEQFTSFLIFIFVALALYFYRVG